MSSRIRTAPSLFLSAFLASTVLTVVACVSARAADDCLNEPKSQAPAGSHWYYRLDRSNHRKCWYLADEGQQVGHVASPRPVASSPPPLPRQTAAAIQSSPADAHAELPMTPTPTEPPQWLEQVRISNQEKVAEVVPEVSPSETSSLPQAHYLVGTTREIDEPASPQSSEPPPGAIEQETAAPPAGETTGGSLRIGLALLLIVLGLSTIGGSLIFRPSAAVGAGRRNAFSSP